MKYITLFIFVVAAQAAYCQYGSYFETTLIVNDQGRQGFHGQIGIAKYFSNQAETIGFTGIHIGYTELGRGKANTIGAQFSVVDNYSGWGGDIRADWLWQAKEARLSAGLLMLLLEGVIDNRADLLLDVSAGTNFGDDKPDFFAGVGLNIQFTI